MKRVRDDNGGPFLPMNNEIPNSEGWSKQKQGIQAEFTAISLNKYMKHNLYKTPLNPWEDT
jgi:hypothetical protein